MRVTLLSPPKPYLVRQRVQAPLGLMYLAAVAESLGHQACVIDMLDMDIDVVPRSEVYGITATTLDIKAAERLARKLKKRDRHSVTVVGGPHVSAIGVMKYESTAWDAVVFGEGEYLFAELLADVGNDALRSQYVDAEPVNLRRIQRPARHLLKGPQGGDIFTGSDSELPPGESTVVSASRGCPGACAFCASKNLWQKIRLRRAWDVVAEMLECVDELGIQRFRFSDDTFGSNEEWLLEFCGRLEGKGVLWRAGVRAEVVQDEKVCKTMYQAGCRELSVGVESGDQRVLNMLRKGTTVEQNVQALKSVWAAGIHSRVLLMAGVPGEHPDTPERTLEFLEGVEFGSIALTQFVPLPGCDVWAHPSRYRCRVVKKPFSKYNVCWWRSDGEAPYEEFILSDLLTRGQVMENVLRLRGYVLQLEKENRG